ncbi:MAG: hypothetical protein R2752_06085 [Vicinamibacterales bacterium]
MAATETGHAAEHAGSTAKIRPIPEAQRREAERPDPRGDRVATLPTVGRPTPVPVPGVDGPTLVAEAAVTALQSLEAIARHTHEVADAFRWNHVTLGQGGLSALVQSTQTLLRLAVTAAEVTGTPFERFCRVGDERADLLTRAAVDEVIAAQMARDWSALAGALDGAFVPAMEAWRDVFGQLVPPAGEPGPGGSAA